MIGVGIIGAGAIGSAIAASLSDRPIAGVQLAAIAGRPHSLDRLAPMAEQWGCAAVTDALLLPAAGAGLVVEAAGAEAARQYAIPLLEAGCDVIIMSAGVLADSGFAAELEAAAAAKSQRVYLPAGSIAGVDGILSAMESGGVEIRVTTTKRPEALIGQIARADKRLRALIGARYLAEQGIDVMGIGEATTVFEGNARDAAAGFPANLNVALTLASAGGGAEHVKVRIVADPATAFTVHKIEVASRSGEILVEMTNRPSAANPKSSWLAALSAVATIRKIASPLRIG